MFKSDVIIEMSKRTGVSLENCRLALDAYMTVVREALAKGDVVMMKRFGMFYTRKRKQRHFFDISKNSVSKCNEKIEVGFKVFPEFDNEVQVLLEKTDDEC